jgi:hypothetical protein
MPSGALFCEVVLALITYYIQIILTSWAERVRLAVTYSGGTVLRVSAGTRFLFVFLSFSRIAPLLGHGDVFPNAFQFIIQHPTIVFVINLSTTRWRLNNPRIHEFGLASYLLNTPLIGYRFVLSRI